ncbi:hypothetical protein M9H77_32178 [Catharanthus roseus]|uniref:Uncharacterized protein n=1 Tax=Catharanthus roseus TaxID=4058 RepID=A0ACC0A633_CATRO|nr:hypothetical protein M9H77_32178 [Catharanthus roseus]
MKAFLRIRCFSSASESSLSSVKWISPLQYVKTQNLDSPAKTLDTISNVPRKRRYMSHEHAINLINREKDPEHALEIFNKASDQKGFNHNNSTYGVILHKLAKYKKFGHIDIILHQMSYETCMFHEGIFINLMKHFSKSHMHQRVLDMFHAIQPIVREKPSLKAISTCLNLLVEANQIDLARTFLLNAQKNLHLKPNTCIFNILVKYHCRKGDLESAVEIVRGMKSSEVSYPNLITYSTLMDGFCRCGRLEEAIEVFEEMVSKDQILPDALTYNLLINGFCRDGKVDRAKKIMEFMKKNGCNPNVVNYSALMNGLCKQGRLEDAKEIFNEMKAAGMQPDKVGYTTLIDYLCRSSRVDEAIELLKEMKETECRADVVTFNVILGGLCRSCRFDEALNMLERLPWDGISLNKASYRIVLNSLCKEGDLNKATELLGLMLARRVLPHFASSNELLVSLCEAGKVANAAVMLFGLVELGFTPAPDTWSLLVDVFCRERKLLPSFQLLDELIMQDW